MRRLGDLGASLLEARRLDQIRDAIGIRPVEDADRDLPPACIGHDRDRPVGVELERDGEVAGDRDERDAASERESAGGGDPDAQPGERPRPHACDDMRDSGTHHLREQIADHLGVAERIGRARLGDGAAVGVDDGDGRSERGVDGEDHPLRVVASSVGSVIRLVRSHRSPPSPAARRARSSASASSLS